MKSNLVYLRILAIVLIVNSHLDALYPSVKFAFGGHLGNSIFYFISGLGLAVSYNRNPIHPVLWGKKRIVKIIVPIILFLGIVHIGQADLFFHKIYTYLIWHGKGQLDNFLPVLIGLYFIFLPVHKLISIIPKIAIFIVMSCVLILFYFRISGLEVIPTDLPSNDVFFTLNALICFMLGIYSAKADFENRLNKTATNVVFSLVVLLLSQGVHQYVLSVSGKIVVANFYLNFISIFSLYFFATSMRLKFIEKFLPFLNKLAMSSLAVYIFHYGFLANNNFVSLPFPFNIIKVYIFSFMIAYPATIMTDNIGSFILQKNK